MGLGKWDATLTRWYFRHLIYGSLPLSVQNALVARHGRKVYALRCGPDCEELMRFLEDSERSTPEDIRAYQEAKLRDMVVHAYETVPYYREVMDERKLKPADISTAQDLTKLPVLSKEDVRAAGTRLLSSAFNKKKLRMVTTSASTGTPLTVYWDRAIAVINHACYMRMRRWSGVPQGSPIAIMQGKPTVPPYQKKPPFWRYNPAWDQIRLSTLHMSDANLPYYMDELRRFGARSLETYPSAAYILARFLEDKDGHLPLDCVVTTGEPLLSEQRRVIEERFQTRVFDAYGQAERVVFATECEKHEGMHLHDEYGITEAVDSEGSPVPTGTVGLIAGYVPPQQGHAVAPLRVWRHRSAFRQTMLLRTRALDARWSGFARERRHRPAGRTNAGRTERGMVGAHAEECPRLAGDPGPHRSHTDGGRDGRARDRQRARRGQGILPQTARAGGGGARRAGGRDPEVARGEVAPRHLTRSSGVGAVKRVRV